VKLDTQRAYHNDVILQTESLSYAVGEARLVDEVSIQVRKGQVVAIVGPSGAGKSSLLRLLNRLDEPTAGTILLDGCDTRGIPPRELRQRLGMVMQTPHLFRGTVAENIRFGPLQRGEDLPMSEVERLLERVNLAGFADRDVAELSGGEAQRVSLARTLANAPEVLLLDEPTSALDESTQLEVESLICSIIRSQKLTCLIVTHDTEQAQRMADTVLVLGAGRMVAFGPIEEVLDA
jgi:putative ABC transport system ATP-binding protein